MVTVRFQKFAVSPGSFATVLTDEGVDYGTMENPGQKGCFGASTCSVFTVLV